MLHRVLQKHPRSFVHITTARQLDAILANRRIDEPTAGIPHRGIVAHTYPDAFGALSQIVANEFPIAIKIEASGTCDFRANEHYLHDDYFEGKDRLEKEDILKEQAASVLDAFGTTILPLGGDGWKVTGFQPLDGCILRHRDSAALAQQRKWFLDLMKQSFFRSLLRIPINHAISRNSLELAESLIEQAPFEPLDQQHVDALFQRCGGRDAVLHPPSPLLSAEEMEALKSAPESIIGYIKSYPEPPGLSPPAFGTEPKHAAAFNTYAKAKFLRKPPPPPPVTYAAVPRAASIGLTGSGNKNDGKTGLRGGSKSKKKSKKK